MDSISKFSVLVIVILISFRAAAQVQEAPDALVKRVSAEVIESVKADQDIQTGNRQKLMELVEVKITPYLDFERMTALATGSYWRNATPDQQKALVNEFHSLVLYTYPSALSQIKTQTLQFKPFRAAPADTEVEVKSQITQLRGEPIQLNYRLEKQPDGWKIFDINFQGTWLIESYKGSFASEIAKSSIAGLIKALAEKNKSLAGVLMK